MCLASSCYWIPAQPLNALETDKKTQVGTLKLRGVLVRLWAGEHRCPEVILEGVSRRGASRDTGLLSIPPTSLEAFYYSLPLSINPCIEIILVSRL